MRKRSTDIYFPDENGNLVYCDEVVFENTYCDAIYKCDENGVLTCLWEKIGEEWVDRVLSIITDAFNYEGYNYLIARYELIYEEDMHRIGHIGSFVYQLYPAKNRVYVAWKAGTIDYRCYGYYDLNNGKAVFNKSSDYSVPFNLTVYGLYDAINNSLSKSYNNIGVLSYGQDSSNNYAWTLYLKDIEGSLIASTVTPNGILSFVAMDGYFVWLSMKDIGGIKYLTAHKSYDLVDVDVSVVNEIAQLTQRVFRCHWNAVIDDVAYFIITEEDSNHCYNAYIVQYNGNSASVAKNITDLINVYDRRSPIDLKKFGDYWFINNGCGDIYLADSLSDSWTKFPMTYPTGVKWAKVAGMTFDNDGTYRMYAYEAINKKVYRYIFKYGEIEEGKIEVEEVPYIKVLQST